MRNYIIVISLLALCSCSKVHKEFYHDGTLMLECEVNILGVNNGFCKNYNRDGTTTLIEHYRNGRLDGELILYYNTGKICYRVDYKEGVLWEISEYNDADGHPLNYGQFKDGNGVICKYTDDGKPLERGTVANGLKEGYWKLYSNKGLYDSILYKNGIREGDREVDIIF